MRVILWIVGVLAALLYVRVGYFALMTLGPPLGCRFGPEVRFWGYRSEAFTHCFNKVPDAVISQYQAVLLGWDRFLAVSLAAFLGLLSIRLRVWVALGAAVVYALSDWLENAFLVSALNGDANAIGWASVLTISKFACLSFAIGMLIRAARQNRSVP